MKRIRKTSANQRWLNWLNYVWVYALIAKGWSSATITPLAKVVFYEPVEQSREMKSLPQIDFTLPMPPFLSAWKVTTLRYLNKCNSTCNIPFGCSILVEKPLCPASLSGCRKVYALASN